MKKIIEKRKNLLNLIDNEFDRWNNIKKLDLDYVYLNKLHSKIIQNLYKNLNKIHKKDFSKKFWRIQIDPWLVSYVASMFDRWMRIKEFLEKNKSPFGYIPKKIILKAPKNYYEHIDNLKGLQWNYLNFIRILNFSFNGKCKFKKKNLKLPVYIDYHKFKKKNFFSHIISFFKKTFLFLTSLLNINNKVVFIDPYIKFSKLLQLNFKMGQSCFYFEKNFEKTISENITKEDEIKRENLLKIFNFSTKNKFEKFLLYSLPHDIPKCLIENFDTLQNASKRINVKPKIILSSIPVEDFKSNWIANCVEKKSKLLIVEHGGSLPPKKDSWFNYEMDVSYKKITWYKKIHKNQIQLPPVKIFKEDFENMTYDLKKNKFLSIILNDQRPWDVRVNYNARSGMQNNYHSNLKKFYENINYKIKKRSLFKSHPSDINKIKLYPDAPYRLVEGISVKKFYGKINFEQKRNFRELLNISRISVCTYPETIFSEAMAANVPTILIYQESFFPRHHSCNYILKSLSEAKILFYDPLKAAMHLNKVYNSPQDWWENRHVKKSRELFFKLALNMDKDWLGEWSKYLKNQLKK